MVCLSIKCFDTTINKKIINRFSQHYKCNVKIASIFVQKVQNWQRLKTRGQGSRAALKYVQLEKEGIMV